MLCRCAALADALPPCRWLEFSPDGCIVVVVGQLGGCFATLFVADLRTFGDVVLFSRSSCWLALVWVVGLEVFSPVFLLPLVVCCSRWVFVCVSSVFFFIFSLL